MTREEIIRKTIELRSTHTAKQIAAEIGHGLTRNAVVGIWARHAPHGLPTRRRPAPAAKPTRPQPVARQKPPAQKPVAQKPTAPAVPAAAPPPSVAAAPEPLGLRLVDLDSCACRWILKGRGDDGEARYCGLHSAPGRAYCAHHARLMYAAPTPKPSSRSRAGDRRTSAAP